MPRTAILFGVLLLALGLGDYYGKSDRDWLVVVSGRDGRCRSWSWAWRRWSSDPGRGAMHAAVIVGLVGFVATAVPFTTWERSLLDEAVPLGRIDDGRPVRHLRLPLDQVLHRGPLGTARRRPRPPPPRPTKAAVGPAVPAICQVSVRPAGTAGPARSEIPTMRNPIDPRHAETRLTLRVIGPRPLARYAVPAAPAFVGVAFGGPHSLSLRVLLLFQTSGEDSATRIPIRIRCGLAGWVDCSSSPPTQIGCRCHLRPGDARHGALV